MTHNLAADSLRLYNDRDRIGLQQMVDHYTPQVIGVIYSVLPNCADADIIAQDIFLKVWDIQKTFDTHPHYISFVKRIAYFRCLDIARQQKVQARRHREYEEFIFSQHPDTDLAMHDLYQAIIGDVAQMPEDRSTRIFTDKHVNGFDNKELADKYKISEAQVRAYLSRLYKKLREKFNFNRKK